MANTTTVHLDMDSDSNSRVGLSNFLSFTWCITRFTKKMPRNARRERLQSEVFCLRTIAGDTEWFLTLYPNGDEEATDGYVSIYVTKKGVSRLPVKAEITLSILDKDGQKTRAKWFQDSFEKNSSSEGIGFEEYISHSSLLLLKDSDLDLLPNDSLTVLCEINITGGHQAEEKPFKGFLARDVHVKNESLNRLSYDMISMTNDKFADFEVVCEGKKFRCHKSVLASRSSVFDAMFTHNMKENRMSSVDILDLDVDTVDNMIVYIYSGQVDELKNKAPGLLAAAEKYDLEELKQMCEVSLSENIDKDNVLDLLLLADLHGACMVRDIALKFIVFNGEEIVTQPGWRDKLAGHPDIIADMFESAIRKKPN